jgi:hypothetical protein
MMLPFIGRLPVSSQILAIQILFQRLRAGILACGRAVASGIGDFARSEIGVEFGRPGGY